MRKRIVAGNWKMNKNHSEAINLVKEIIDLTYDNSVQLIVIPPSIFVTDIVEETLSSNIEVGVQNSSQFQIGAYTGELSATMIKSTGVEYVLVGHSERRECFKELNVDLALKVNQLLKNDLTPIYCCGEKLEEREKENHFNLIKSQI
ncbi:MAG: triosephosphate isomerase, partial [Flavobacteriales bacterium]|nr:triosephosphate isomerase [Flavobacteriales bacterium]